MSEETLEVLIEYNNEVEIPDRAFWTMIKIIEEYCNNNGLNETAMMEIATASMMLWEYGSHIRNVVKNAIYKLGYNKLGSVRKKFDQDEYYDGYHRL